MHCVAGVGLLAGAVLARMLRLGGLLEVALEYELGFAFGWTVFQALFMRDMVGGSYIRSLTSTFVPELVSMNLLMTGMVPTMMILMMQLGVGADPTIAAFWFVMSMSLLVDFIAAYPMNWWLVRYNLKHSMMTVRPDTAAPVAAMSGDGGHDMTATHAMPAVAMGDEATPRPPIFVTVILSIVALSAGLAITSIAAPT
jgi:hypothetical protein